MASLTTALETEFTPAAGDFIVQCTKAPATLLRKNVTGLADFASVGTLMPGDALICSNPVAGAIYKFTALSGTPRVSADQ